MTYQTYEKAIILNTEITRKTDLLEKLKAKLNDWEKMNTFKRSSDFINELSEIDQKIALHADECAKNRIVYAVECQINALLSEKRDLERQFKRLK